jgi:hypothetical protein
VGGTTIEGVVDSCAGALLGVAGELAEGDVAGALAAGGVAAQTIWTENVRKVAETSAMRFMGKLLGLPGKPRHAKTTLGDNGENSKCRAVGPWEAIVRRKPRNTRYFRVNRIESAS